MRVYNATDVARYIIAYEAAQGRPVSNLRLQKLLYFVQANCIVSTDKPCFSSRMEAWDYGPVVPSVYREYCIYAGAAIPASPITSSLNAIATEDAPPVNSMLDRCASISTTNLVSISHKQAPWFDAYHNPLTNEITAQSIKNYFRS